MSRRRVVLGVCAIGVVTLLLSGCDARFRGTSTFTDDASVQQKVASVRIENRSGTVRIHVGTQAVVHRTVYHTGDKPGQTFHYEADTLVLEDCKRNNCSIDYDVVIPEGAKVIGEVGSGDLDLSGMTEVGVQAGSGDIAVRDVTGPVTVKATSGNIQLSGLAQSVVAEASSGDITINGVKGDVTALARSGDVVATGIGGKTSVENSSGDVTLDLASVQNVKATATSGNIVVKVPRGEPCKVTATTRSGDESVNITSDPAARYALELDASSGDINVDYR
jgi:DUF4097 and DUF4098 domain-containing protein YvlB